MPKRYLDEVPIGATPLFAATTLAAPGEPGLHRKPLASAAVHA